MGRRGRIRLPGSSPVRRPTPWRASLSVLCPIPLRWVRANLLCRSSGPSPRRHALSAALLPCMRFRIRRNRTASKNRATEGEDTALRDSRDRLTGEVQWLNALSASAKSSQPTHMTSASARKPDTAMLARDFVAGVAVPLALSKTWCWIWTRRQSARLRWKENRAPIPSKDCIASLMMARLQRAETPLGVGGHKRCRALNANCLKS